MSRVYANYGFDSKAVDNDAQIDALRGRTAVEPRQQSDDSGVNKVILRYSDKRR